MNSITGKVRLQIESIYNKYHHPEYLKTDPLQLVHEFSRNSDREIAGLIVSILAYGRVEMIIRNCEWIFNKTGKDLSGFVSSTTYNEKCRLFKGFKHRFNDHRDIALAFECISRTIKERGTIEGMFVEGSNATDGSIRTALDKFTKELKSYADRISDHGKSFDFLFTSPENGSACKRINMYLRWMARPNDGIDLGVWRNVPTSSLVVPVDTHIAAVSRFLKLTKRETPDWTMAEEITGKLRMIDPEDPVRFDFSLCRAGMLRRDNEI
jgi:uncharacterized protein (TIGR02757 family)